jgi:hypothetical protein
MVIGCKRKDEKMEELMDPTIRSIIRECLNEMDVYEPKWEEDDIFLAACGAVLKYVEKHVDTIGEELLADIEITVKKEMDTKEREKQNGTYTKDAQ